MTLVEHWARRQAGETGVGRGFIDQYIEGVLYPERYTHCCRCWWVYWWWCPTPGLLAAEAPDTTRGSENVGAYRYGVTMAGRTSQAGRGSGTSGARGGSSTPSERTPAKRATPRDRARSRRRARGTAARRRHAAAPGARRRGGAVVATPLGCSAAA